MKATTLFSLLCFSFSITVFAQSPDFSKIDAHARGLGGKYSKDLTSLATALKNGCSNEKEQVRAIFVWIADNIKYDIKTLENKKDIDLEKRIALQEAPHVLKSKKAVCEGYANLMIALCKAIGIEALQVEGKTKNSSGRVSKSGHAWCLVRADGQWGLVDPTWGAGEVDLDEGKYYEKFKDFYFFTPPETMIINHFPLDPLMQLLPAPITQDEFGTQTPAFIQAKKSGPPRAGYAHLRDSLNTFITLDSVEIHRSQGVRLLELDPNSNFGLYKLGLYHYRKAYQSIRAYEAKLGPAQTDGKGLTKAWCEQGIQLLEAGRKKLTESIAVFDRSNHHDEYSADIKNFRRAAEMAKKSVEKNLESMQKLMARLK